jgi:environmental stress-induced protein Ves
MKLIQQADYRVMPWKNGGGITTEIHVSPPSTSPFDWRVSMAQVGTDGPFSIFTGYDRHIMVLAGNGMSLDFAGGDSVVLKPLKPFSFSGDAVITGRLLQGAVVDFNLMINRRFGAGTLTSCKTTGTYDVEGGPGLTVVHILNGNSILLDEHEKATFAAGQTLVISRVTPRLGRAPDT